MTDDVLPLRDRTDAGERLADALTSSTVLPRLTHPLVLALPRGGVPVAAPVAAALGAALDVLVVRKLGLPTNPEYGFGAIGERDVCLTDERIIQAADLREDEIAQVIARERAELARRRDLYRPGKPDLDLTGRAAVLVDDGAATGATIRAAIAVARALDAATVVVAVGACPPDVLSMLTRDADHAVAALTAEPFLAVGQWYENFGQVSDAEVRDLLGVTSPPISRSARR